MRVGGGDLIEVDFRLVAATNRDLEEEVQEGRFREDLYYRINVIELNVPALRERGDDVLQLAEHILRRLDRSASLREDTRNALFSYRFPGNVRELENMLERAVTLCVSGVITPDDLHMRETSDPVTSKAAVGKLGERVEDVQRQAIVEALEKTRYNKTAAAKLLGLSFRQLRYRIKKLGID